MKLKEHSPYSASRLDLFAEKLLEASRTGPTDYLLIEPYSIGDAFHTLALVDEFRGKYCQNGQQVNLICNVRSLPLVKIFRNINYAIGIDCGPHEYQLEALAERYGPVPVGRPILMPPDMYARGWLGRLSGAGRLNPIEAKKLILELGFRVNPRVPQLDETVLEAIKPKAEKIGLGAHSVIIFNHANTMKEVNPEIYKPLVKYWGDRIFYDATIEGKGNVSWARPLTMAIDEIPYYAQLAGTVICIRSGITDLLSCCDTNIITVYPNTHLVFDWSGDKAEVVQSFKNLTLEKLGLIGKAREYPLFLDDNDTAEAIAEKLDAIIKNLLIGPVML